VILNANEGEGLVWLGIPAADFAAAVRFFGETLGLDVAFDEGNTVEPSGRERRQDPAVRPRGTAIRALPQPEASIFPLLEVDDLGQAHVDPVRSGVEISGEPESDGVWT